MSIGHPLTDEQIIYVRKHFKDTKNQDIADALGISKSAVSRVQKKYGLSKSKEHSHLMSVKAGKASFDARGGRPLNLTPEVIAKRVETYRNTLRLERARRTFGLPQRTKIKVVRQPKQKCSQRAYLKKRGYILDEPNCVAYYTVDTKRATRMEAYTKKRSYYKFMSYEEL